MQHRAAGLPSRNAIGITWLPPATPARSDTRTHPSFTHVLTIKV
jgi:hypothetical protein